jgi:NAD(P)-dependent dehydrogenase (short-subunit alcohol dehydrogenase family)
MMRERAGHVVNISSVGGRIAVPHLAAYSVGKFALTALSEGLHAELKKYGVSVTTVTPHVMRTGSHRNVLVRGQHAKEALWFALASATPLTSIDADDAAREVVEAVKAGRATVTPGWQAQAAVIAKTAAPDLFADIAAWVSSALLPGATRADEADQARLSRDINLLFAARAFPTRASERFNQPVAEDERTWRAGPHDSAPSTGERHEVAQER